MPPPLTLLRCMKRCVSVPKIFNLLSAKVAARCLTLPTVRYLLVACGPYSATTENVVVEIQNHAMPHMSAINCPPKKLKTRRSW